MKLFSDLARPRYPAPHRICMLKRRQRLGLVPADRENFAAVVALNRIDVSEIPVRHQGDFCARAGQQRIQADCCAVHEKFNRSLRRNSDFDSPQHGKRRIFRRRKNLDRLADPACRVLTNNVGERAAYVGCDSVVHCAVVPDPVSLEQVLGAAHSRPPRANED